ncbi:MAG: HAD family phosphatase [Verrucomicrobia bacterium]|nr:HAD family phosphatase [Verrucomicrobiota bacterium]
MKTFFKRAVQAIIFDMDGVLVDSEPRHEQAFLKIFDEMGYGDRHGIHFPDYYGKSDAALWRAFMDRHQPPQSFDFLCAWKQKVFLEILRRDEPLFPDIPDLVRDAAGSYPLAVASGSYHPVISEVLRIQDLRRFFPVVSSVEDVEKNKPAPDVFLHAARGLGVAPESCCVIEDSAAGVEGALAAGMQVIAITNSLPADKLERATVVVENYRQIRSLLLN